jgi:hypothetical protein
MPGAAIGTKLPHPSGDVWKGEITIVKKDTIPAYEYHVQKDVGDVTVGSLVHQRLQEVVKTLNKPPRVRLSDKELLDFSGEHILHELQTCAWLAEEKIPDLQRIGLEISFEVATSLESFAIHMRNLINFFYPGRGQDDDVIASNFFDSPSGWAPAKISPSLENARERANKEISHITRGRKSGLALGKEWPVGDLFREVEALAKQFAAAASPKKLDSEIGNLLNSSGKERKERLWHASGMSTNTAVTAVTNEKSVLTEGK